MRRAPRYLLILGSAALCCLFVWCNIRFWSRSTVERAVETKLSGASPLKSLLRGKRVLVVLHAVALAGAQMLAAEQASLFARDGAEVSLFLAEGPGSGLDRLGISRKVSIFANETGLDAGSFDLVIAHTISVSVLRWCRMARPKIKGRLLLHIHESGAWADRLQTSEEVKLLLPLVDGLLYDSFYSYQYWNQVFANLPMPNLNRVLHWGVTDEKKRRLEEARNNPKVRKHWRDKLGFAEDDVMVLYLASPFPHKGIDIVRDGVDKAVKLCGTISKVKLGFVTAGGAPEEVKELRGPRNLPATSPELLFAAADVYAASAWGKHGENWGLSVVESMMLGLPTLACRKGGALEQIVHGKTGLLHTCGEGTLKGNQSDEIAVQICSLLINPTARQQLGEEARRSVENRFSERQLRADLFEALDLVLSDHYPLYSAREQGFRNKCCFSNFTPVEGADLDVPSLESTFVDAGQYVYSMGGYEGLQKIGGYFRVWDKSKRLWKRAFKLWDNFPASHVGSELVQQKWWFLVGGQLGPRCSRGSNQVSVIDISAHLQTLIPLTSLPIVIYSPVVFALEKMDGKDRVVVLHVLGGAVKDRTTVNDRHFTMTILRNEVLVREGVWTEDCARPPLPTLHASKAVVVGNSVYFYGGHYGHSNRFCYPYLNRNVPEAKEMIIDPVYGESASSIYVTLNHMWVYDGVADKFERKADGPLSCSHCPAVFDKDKNSIIMMGFAQGSDKIAAHILEYSIELDAWAYKLNALPFPVKGVVMFRDGDKFFISGGQRGSLTTLLGTDVLKTTFVTKVVSCESK